MVDSNSQEKLNHKATTSGDCPHWQGLASRWGHGPRAQRRQKSPQITMPRMLRCSLCLVVAKAQPWPQHTPGGEWKKPGKRKLRDTQTWGLFGGFLRKTKHG